MMMRIFFMLLTISLVACKEEIPETNSSNQPEIKSYGIASSQAGIFHAPKFPDTIIFADEIIPLTDLDIRERLDRELVVNNFWHSNTLFYFKRANRWFPIMRPILEEENIPLDFLYLAVIESGLTQATSPSNAKGFWQFLKGTAQDYGLIVNDQIDERLHVEKSTRAACMYLRAAYEKFNSWSLAAAAYNRGKGGINNDLNLQQVNSFFDLYLNEETSRYLFRILAVKFIMENPKDFGFHVDDEDLYPPYNVQVVELEEGTYDLVEWSLSKGINYKILKLLNPWIIGKSLNVLPNQAIYLSLPDSPEQLSVLGV